MPSIDINNLAGLKSMTTTTGCKIRVEVDSLLADRISNLRSKIESNIISKMIYNIRSEIRSKIISKINSEIRSDIYSEIENSK